MNSNHLISVTGIFILQDGMFSNFKEVVEPIIRDTKLKKLIVVSTDTKEQAKLEVFAKMYASKIVLAYEDKNKGSAYIFSRAVSLAKNEKTDYVLFLDEDAIPEEGFLEKFFDNLKYFKHNETSHVVMIANTIDIFGKEKSFYSSVHKKYFKDGTLFDIFTIRKIKTLIQGILKIENTGNQTQPVFRTQAFIGGGSLIPMAAITTINLPLSSLYTHGEDIEYAWRIKEAGYSFFQCSNPIVRRPSSENKGNPVFGLFNKQTKDREVYYHIRNAVLISRLHTYQSKPILLINVISWISLALLLGITKTRSPSLFFRRVKIIIQAAFHGYR